MLDTTTKQKIDSLRNLLVGKVPDPKSQVEQITVALFYKFMWDRDKEIKDLGGNATFFIGEFEKYSWVNLFAPDLGGSECIKLYSEAIEEMENNPNIPSIFRDIFKRAFLPYNDPYTLRLFLKEINDFHYSNSEKLGDGFEYLLSILGTQGDAGQFRTPRHIIDFITEVVNPQKGDRICDPACGTAGFIISAYKHIFKTNTKESLGDLLTPEDKKRLGNNLVGLDIDPMMVKLALANMYLHGLNEPHIYEYDSLTSEERWDDIYDVVLANPPFMTPSGGIRPHKRFAVNATKAEVLFTSYINTHLSNNGRAGIVVPEGIIFQSSIAYKNLRKQLIESSLIGVISLPGGVFNPYSGVKTSILILDKVLNKKTDKIFFCKVENDGFDLGSQRREIEKNDLPRIKKAIKEYYDGFDDDDLSLNYLSKQEILNSNDLNLNYDSYLKYDYSKVEYKICSLGDLIEVEYGKRIVKKNDSGTIYPVYGGGGETFKTNTFNRKDRLIISRFAMSPKCVRIVSGEFFLNDSGFTVKLKNSDLCIEDYLNNILVNIQDKIYKCGKGAAQKNINFDSFLNLKIPLPPLEIQKEIVEELEQYQKVIDGAKQVVKNYKPHFEIDESWEKVELGKICKLVGGGTPSKKIDEYWGGEIKWLSCADFSIDPFYIESSLRKITSKGLNNSSSNLIKKGTVVLVTRVSLGKVAIIKDDFAINQDLTGLYFDNSIIENEFALLALKSLAKHIILCGTGSTVKGVTRDFVKKLQLPVPSLKEQKTIVNKISDERKIIEGNKKLIEIYSKKIEDRINKIWGE
jgi:type I restriction enzyme M protein